MYGEYLRYHLLNEPAITAYNRALKWAESWAERNSARACDALRYGNHNAVCFAITTGRISPWVLYNCASGQEFLGKLDPDGVAMIWEYINSDAWQKKFQEFPADLEYVSDLLRGQSW